MGTWRGHFQITHFVRQALLKKKAGAERTDFSPAEAVLFNACEFWAAAATRELAQYLGTHSVPKLFAAFEAFTELGAVRISSTLRIVINDWPNKPSQKWLHQRASELETRLLDTDDPVDQLIAQYASRHLNISLSEKDSDGGKAPLMAEYRGFHKL